MNPSTPAQKYVLASLHNHQSEHGPLPCTAEEFLTSVRAEVLLLDPDVNLDKFFAAIDQALATDRALKSAGRPPTAFEDLPERAILKKAIANAILDQRLPRGTRRPHEGLRADGEPDPGPDPAASAIIAERVAAVRRAMKGVPDSTNRAILKMLFFDGDCKNQAQVAKKLGLSTSTVSRRLDETLCLLRDRLEDAEPT